MATPLNLLIVEDSADDAALLVDELRSAGFDPVWKRVETEPDFRAALGPHLDLIFADHNLPQFSGYRALELFLAAKLPAPFVVVSGTIGEERAVECLKAGATDVVLKGHFERLVPVVQRALDEVRERAERRNLEDQLLQVQKMESVGLLAGGIAHDFNNLLTIIQINASTLRTGLPLDADAREAVEQIALAAEQAATLTRQLLTFSRKQVANPQNLDLNELVGNLTKMLKRILGEDILLHVNYNVPAPLIRADAGMLEQVVMNLAVNARDAMPRGGQLSVTTSMETIDADYVRQHPQARTGSFICLAVNDTGEGIPASIQRRIFEPFFTTKVAGKGTGLGLAMVYGIVQEHQGWITVRSDVGRGAEFRVYLPAAAAPERKAAELAPGNALPGGAETILLVEDEAAVRKLARVVLERRGYTVIEAESGVQALELWPGQRERIDLVLTDMVMPGGVTGRDLGQKLQAERPALPVLYSSGYSAEMAGTGLRLVEGVNFLQKPYSVEKLAQIVRQVLDQARNRSAKGEP